MASKQTRQTWREAGTHHHGDATFLGQFVETPQTPHVITIIGRRNHRCSGQDESLGQRYLGNWCGEHYGIQAEFLVERIHHGDG
jgi:hypothetical protein